MECDFDRTRHEKRDKKQNRVLEVFFAGKEDVCLRSRSAC